MSVKILDLQHLADTRHAFTVVSLRAIAHLTPLVVVSALRSRSPDGLDAVLPNERIRGKNGELLQLALGDQQPIKGIAVEGRQRIHVERMTEVNGEGRDVVPDKMIGQKWG